ncbi:MAG: molybdopterin-dependent oxidoreductase [Bryobacterales bacterium]|nr:molybdopterin-dependent oxidoreductase [Bryobacterales bacterium]
MLEQQDFVIEPERYELLEAPAYTFTPTRREFVEVLGAGVVLTIFSRNAEAQQSTQAARLHLGDDGTVTLFSGKVEGGQGARTELAMAAAEELRLPLEKVRVVLADTDLTPNDGITAGSRSTPSTVPAVRKACAAARQIKEQRGAKSYGELAKGTRLDDDADLTKTEDWRLLGTAHHHLEARAIVTGEHKYPSDIQWPNMLYGAVLRAPAYNSTLRYLDTSVVPKNVTVVREGNFVGCTAPTSYEARKAVAALAAKAQWQTGPHPPSSGLAEYLKTHTRGGGRANENGAVDAELSKSAQRLKATYSLPYIQHAPMEPRAAVAEWNDGRLTVWTATQNPFGVRDQVAKAFSIPIEKVHVIVPDFGGGFGGKHTGETAIEAARLAKDAGRPVSLRWTRAEEFTWAYFRPAGVFDIQAGLDGAGRMTAWDFTNYNAGTAGIASPYRAPSRTKFVQCESPLREGSYRGIAATANNYARECFIDELAAAAKMSPLEFRLNNLENDRLKDVLRAAAERFAYERRAKQRKQNTGIGIACGTEKGSYVAACVEVECGETLRVTEFCTAFECGAILNPSNLKAQVEGSIIQGLGAALSEEMVFEGGKLQNGSFQKYRVPRFRDVPKLDTLLVNRKDLPPAGAGETPIIVVAPAIAAAIYQGSGRRVRQMPFRLT